MIAAVLALSWAALAAPPAVDDSGARRSEPAHSSPGHAVVVDNAAVVVDLNRASVTELCTLPGIGPKKAEAIVVLRSKRPFTRVTQLLQIKGIGPKTLDRLKSRVTLAPAVAPPSTVAAPAAPAGHA